MIVLCNIMTLNTTTSKSYFQPLISRLNVGEGSFQDVPIQPTFLQVCVLGAGDSFVSTHSFHTSLVTGVFYLNFRLAIGWKFSQFESELLANLNSDEVFLSNINITNTQGLSTLVYSEEISCGIVSLGAECIEISKEFFLKNASENYLRKLKATVSSWFGVFDCKTTLFVVSNAICSKFIFLPSYRVLHRHSENSLKLHLKNFHKRCSKDNKIHSQSSIFICLPELVPNLPISF